MAQFIGEYRRRSGFATLTAMFIWDRLVHERCGRGKHPVRPGNDLFAKPSPQRFRLCLKRALGHPTPNANLAPSTDLRNCH